MHYENKVSEMYQLDREDALADDEQGKMLAEQILSRNGESKMKVKQVFQTEDGTTFSTKGAAELHQKGYEAIQELTVLIKEEFSNKDDQRDVLDFILTYKTYLADIFKKLDVEKESVEIVNLKEKINELEKRIASLTQVEEKDWE